MNCRDQSRTGLKLRARSFFGVSHMAAGTQGLPTNREVVGSEVEKLRLEPELVSILTPHVED